MPPNKHPAAPHLAELASNYDKKRKEQRADQQQQRRIAAHRSQQYGGNNNKPAYNDQKQSKEHRQPEVNQFLWIYVYFYFHYFLGFGHISK
jgi:hypothetical protein